MRLKISREVCDSSHGFTISSNSRQRITRWEVSVNSGCEASSGCSISFEMLPAKSRPPGPAVTKAMWPSLLAKMSEG